MTCLEKKKIFGQIPSQLQNLNMLANRLEREREREIEREREREIKDSKRTIEF